MRARGIAPSVEARAKAAELNRAKPKKVRPICSEQGCEAVSQSKGLCKPHYDKQHRSSPELKQRRQEQVDAQIAEDPNFYRRQNIRRYGITLEEAEILAHENCNLCAICQTLPTGRGASNKLHVDHCHASGMVRSMLCYGCNTGLGHFKENVTIMLSAIEYLRLHGTMEEELEAF